MHVLTRQRISRLRTLTFPALQWPVLGLLLFVSAFALPGFTAVGNADQGWAQLLAQLSQIDARFGVDVIFPYGPLHELVLGAYHPERFWWKYALEILGKGAMTLLLLRLARQLPSTLGSLWLAGLTLMMLTVPAHTELAMLAGVAALLVPLLQERPNRIDTLVACAYLAAISLTKFTLCPFAMIGVLVLSLRAGLSRERWIRSALAPIAGYGVFLSAFFILGGQRLGDLLAFLASGFAYSAAYGDGMALEGPKLEVRLALIILALFSIGLLGTPRRNWPIATILLFTALLAWKAGFTRHDAHAFGFFGMLLFLPALVLLAHPQARPGPLLLATLLSGIGLTEVLLREKLLPTSMVGQWPEHARQLLKPGHHRDRLERQRQALAAEHDLPRIRSIVGDATIDAYTDCQGIALLNGFRLTPRPTLQSVNAVHPDWLERNAAILRGHDAPRFLLLDWISFDLRYPTLSDGPALLAMLEHYGVCEEEKGYLLLERRPQCEMDVTTVLTRRAAMDEVIELPANPGEIHTARLGVKLTSLGKLRSAAYRPPVLFFLVRDESGIWHPYRLTAGMARAEFLLDPLCTGNSDLKRLFENQPGRRISAVRLHIMRSERALIEAEYDIRITSKRRK